MSARFFRGAMRRRAAIVAGVGVMRDLPIDFESPSSPRRWRLAMSLPQLPPFHSVER